LFLAFAGAVGPALAAVRGGPTGRQAAPPARVPAPSLTSPASAVKAPDADGFIRRWLILEPISVSGQLGDSAVQTTVKKEYFPHQLAVIPRDGERVTVDGTELAWHAVDTKEFNVNLLHFARAQGMRYENVLFWAVAVVNCPREMRDVRLAVGSNAASVWWVNGKEVVDLYQNRQSVVDDGVSKRLTLNQGPNVVRCAVINSTGATDFCARFLDAEEKPLKEFTISLSAAGK
jgi:hypothetical protein